MSTDKQKTIVLEYLKNISNTEVRIPVISINKSYSYSELITEVEKQTPVGIAFIKEFYPIIVIFGTDSKKWLSTLLQFPEPGKSETIKMIEDGWTIFRINDNNIELRKSGHHVVMPPGGTYYAL